VDSRLGQKGQQEKMGFKGIQHDTE
jgi:hypothetical protein